MARSERDRTKIGGQDGNTSHKKRDTKAIQPECTLEAENNTERRHATERNGGRGETRRGDRAVVLVCCSACVLRLSSSFVLSSSVSLFPSERAYLCAREIEKEGDREKRREKEGDRKGRREGKTEKVCRERRERGKTASNKYSTPALFRMTHLETGTLQPVGKVLVDGDERIPWEERSNALKEEQRVQHVGAGRETERMRATWVSHGTSWALSAIHVEGDGAGEAERPTKKDRERKTERGSNSRPKKKRERER